MKHRVFLIATLFCLALGGVCSCSQEQDASSSRSAQSAARPDLNDPEQRAELVENLSKCFRFWGSRDVIVYKDGVRQTPTPGESLEKWRQAKGLTKEDMADFFARIIRERLAELETAPDSGKFPALYLHAQRYLNNYPLPQEEFMALVRKTVDLDPDHGGDLAYSYIKTYPDWIFDDGTFVEITERVHSSMMSISSLLEDMFNQIGKETDEARKKKLLDKAFEWALRDDNLENFVFLDRLLLDHDKKRYATHPGRKLQLEKDLKCHEEAKRYDWVYRRTKYALEHFGEGDEAFEMLYKMDTDLKLRDGEWERAERKRREREHMEEMKKAGKDPRSVYSKEYLEEIYRD